MTEQLLESENYHGVGSTLPIDNANIPGVPIYWAKTPSEYSTGCCSKLCCYSLCSETFFGYWKWYPIYWPHMILCCMGPASCVTALTVAEENKDRYWIVTDSELVRVKGGNIDSMKYDSSTISNVMYRDEEDPATFKDKLGGCCCYDFKPALIVERKLNGYVRFSNQNIKRGDSFYGCPPEFYRELMKARRGGNNMPYASSNAQVAAATYVSHEPVQYAHVMTASN
jgi:hypothetical protein